MKNQITYDSNSNHHSHFRNHHTGSYRYAETNQEKQVSLYLCLKWYSQYQYVHLFKPFTEHERQGKVNNVRYNGHKATFCAL